ncbi:MAG: M48 family metalloprotease [Cytophagales bacterium]|nr:M48 family metalloprotease [Cytophagales bacterium]
MRPFVILFTAILALGIFTTCSKKSDDTSPNCEVVNINVFSLSDDVALGKSFHASILTTPGYAILDSVQYATAYGHLNRIKNNILASSAIENKDKLAWKAYILKNDTTLNAFCTPGGYIYVYTGIIKYLDTEDDFAGVLGHEMGHAALRHSTKAMTSEYGVGTLLSIVTALLGNSSTAAVASSIANIAANLGSLKYSRCHETEADDASVRYLNGSVYKCNGAASFFQKLIASGGTSSTPVFLSTHPDPGNRVTSINSKSASLGCNTLTGYSGGTWAAFKASLP